MRSGVLAAALLAPALALADGRAPLTSGVYFQPGDPRAIYVRATFGLLISRDDGCTFRWVCEQAIGYGGQFDPKYRIAADGAIFATTFTGLRVSRDGGCTWQTAPVARPADVWIDAIDIGPTGDVWVATAESARPNDVYRSTDGGRTFAPRGMRSPTVWWKSVRVAPSNPQRIYVTGYQVAPPPAAHLHRSDDAGARWTASALAGVRYGGTPLVLVAGVDPANHDVVFATSVGANPPRGDRLYRSTDAGATFAEVLATTAAIGDLAFHDGRVIVATTGGGAFASRDRGATFGALAGAPQLGCLASHRGRLIGCGANWQPDWKAVARSADGATWDELFRFVELAGPVRCPAGTTVHDKCAPLWPSLQQQFGATGPTCAAAPSPAPVSPPPAAPDTSGGGCCGIGSPGGAGALAGAVALLVRRRRLAGSGGAASEDPTASRYSEAG